MNLLTDSEVFITAIAAFTVAIDCITYLLFTDPDRKARKQQSQMQDNLNNTEE